MYDIIPLGLILLSLFIIVIIIIRKFPVLASLDVDTIKQEKEAQFKEQIISNRLRRNIIHYNSKVVKIFVPVKNFFLDFIKGLYKKLVDFKDNYNKEAVLENADAKGVEDMIIQAETLVKDENLEEAEKKYIDIISLDSQNIRAFKGLGKLYQEKKQYREAKQTFEHVLRLLEQDEAKQAQGGEEATPVDMHALSSIYYELSLVCKDNNEQKASLDSIVKATEIEPSNPRYLDMLLEMSIITKEKGIALDALKALKEANPENNKLVEFEEKIRAL